MAEDSDILRTLRKEHPRLIFTREMEKEAKLLRKKDDYYAALCDIVERSADCCIDEPVVKHKKTGRRLLTETRKSMERIGNLSAAYRMTGEEKYLKRAEQEMLAACALKDWNPSHFLDTAEMSAGLAIGYDWLYGKLSAATRRTIRTAIIEKGLKPGLDKTQWWTYCHNNWNQVCNGGLMMAALAIAEEEPEWARKAVERALDGVKVCMQASYDPMGVYPEGASYWGYGTSYNVMMIASLETALGDDFGLTKMKGFSETPIYRIQVVGPDGYAYNYSDSGLCSKHLEPALFWFGKRYGRSNVTSLTKRVGKSHFDALNDPKRPTRTDRYFPFMMAWYGGCKDEAVSLALDYLGNGSNPLAMFRSSWDRDALWLAGKGGDNTNSHNHMDAGSFVMVAGGVRWSQDLDRDSYHKIESTIGGLWEAETRYTLFRFGVQGHSTLCLNGKWQALEGSASPITTFHSSCDRSHAVIDMSNPWREEAKSVRRGLALLNKRSFLVQDEVEGCKGEILWQMITVKNCEVDGETARLTKRGKHFTARIMSPEGATFEMLSVRPKHAVECQNADIGRLGIRVASNGTRVTIAVHMWLEDGDPPAAPPLLPLKRWTNDDTCKNTVKGT